MYKLMLSLLICFMLTSCEKEQTIDYNKVLHDKMDGIYLLNRAFADEFVDLNQDGLASNDMLREIPNLKNSNLEIKISSTFKYFYILWPEQDPRQFPSSIWNEKGLIFQMDFDEQNNQLLFEKKNNDAITGWFPPEEAQFLNNTVRIKMKRTLLTSAGLKEVMIDATYERMSTYKSEYR